MRDVRAIAFLILLLLGIVLTMADIPDPCQGLTPDNWFWWWYYGCGGPSAGGGGGGAG
jgi:hypothetical protein